MVDPTTANTSLAVPIRGTDTGTWDTPVNNNFNAIDSMFGGVVTVVMSSANVTTLLSSQGQSSVIRLTGTLPATNLTIILPSIFKGWTIDNQILNSPSSFCVFLATSGSSYFLGVPPGVQDVFYDGSIIKYRNLGKVGEYWDYASTLMPTWVTASTIPPYLHCDGTTFSSATYPILANLLGGTTRPDARGRVRAAMNEGLSRTTSVIADTLLNAGGDQNVQIHSHTNILNDPTHTHIILGGSGNQGLQSGTGGPVNIGGTGSGGTNVALSNQASATGMTITNANFGTGASLNMQPTYLGGLTLIRAA